MYRAVEDFLKDWNAETEETLKIFNALTPESLEQRVTPEGRSLAFLAWHLVLAIPSMLSEAGQLPDFPHLPHERPDTIDEIATHYTNVAGKAADYVRSWPDEKLMERVAMYGEEWTLGYTLNAVICHQIHHRAQMTVLMRQAGVNVPGIYGPSREEWAQFGMEPQP